MKKLTLLIISLALLIPMLSGCIIIPQYKNFEIDATTVVSIEIYDLYRDTEIVETEEYDPYLLEPRPYETTSVYTIPEEEKADFLNDLAKIQFTDYIIIVPAPIDPSFDFARWTARINYTDGSYEFISCYGYGETYDANGECIGFHHYGCDNNEWWALIEKYTPEDIFSQTYEWQNKWQQIHE